jgi:hypothetical protein
MLYPSSSVEIALLSRKVEDCLHVSAHLPKNAAYKLVLVFATKRASPGVFWMIQLTRRRLSMRLLYIQAASSY